MEYEISDEPKADEDEGDSALVRDHPALKNQSSVDPGQYPETKDRALHIPEQED